MLTLYLESDRPENLREDSKERSQETWQEKSGGESRFHNEEKILSFRQESPTREEKVFLQF